MARVATRRNTLVAIFLAGMVVAAAPAQAQVGVRGGVSVDPDQAYVGVHYETAALVERLHFKPNLEVGFGNDLTSVTGNFEFVWKFPRPGRWGVYAGGGPAVNYYSFDGSSATEAGFNLLIGVESSQGLAFEAKFGVGDSPDLKFGVGYTWR